MSFRYFLFLIFILVSCSSHKIEVENQINSLEDINLKNNNDKVALFVHGLNQRPEKMLDLMTEFHQIGYDCYLIKLKGHSEKLFNEKENQKLVKFKNATFNDWLNDFDEIYKKIKNDYNQIIVVGYSLGGVVALNYLELNKVKVDKLLLIAPAIAIHSLNYSVKLLSLFPSFVIPSLSPKIYRANYGTPVSAYLSLYKGIKIFEENNIKHVNVKSFIILNENDELVSYKKVKNLIEEKKLDKWKVFKISKTNVPDEFNYEHLIIDKKTLGDSWNIMINYIYEF